MKLRVMVEVMDDDGSNKVRRLRTVEIPKKVLKLNGMLCESREELREQVAQDAVSKAMSTVTTPEAAVGLSDIPATPTPSAPASARGKQDAAMNKAFGFDLMEHMDKVDGQAPMYGTVQREVGQGQGARVETVTGPPPIGYGPGTRRR